MHVYKHTERYYEAYECYLYTSIFTWMFTKCLEKLWSICKLGLPSNMYICMFTCMFSPKFTNTFTFMFTSIFTFMFEYMFTCMVICFKLSTISCKQCYQAYKIFKIYKGKQFPTLISIFLVLSNISAKVGWTGVIAEVKTVF